MCILPRFLKMKKGLPEAEERGNEELVFNGCTVSIWGDRKFLEMEGGNGYVVQCTTVSMYLVSLNCTLQMVKIINVMYILPVLKRYKTFHVSCCIEQCYPP